MSPSNLMQIILTMKYFLKGTFKNPETGLEKDGFYLESAWLAP
jgi:hypothetical protein